MMTSFMYNSFVDAEDTLAPNKIDMFVDSQLASNKEMCNKLFVAYNNSTTSMDKGFIFEDIDRISRLMIKVYIPDGVPITTERLGINIIYWIEVYSEHKSTIVYIKYSKIQDVLANLGGIINFMRIVFTVVIFFINHYNMPFGVFTHIFLNTHSTIPLGNNIKTKIMSTLNESSLKNTIINSEVNILKRNIIPNTNLKEEGNHTVKLKAEKNFRVGVFRYMWANCMRRKQVVSAMDVIINKFNKELDIGNYMLRIEDMYMMKALVFKKIERDVFNRGLNFGEVVKSVYDHDPEDKGYMEYVRASFNFEHKYRSRILAQDEMVKQIQKRFCGGN